MVLKTDLTSMKVRSIGLHHTLLVELNSSVQQPVDQNQLNLPAESPNDPSFGR